jgi:hypothetical protein
MSIQLRGLFRSGGRFLGHLDGDQMADGQHGRGRGDDQRVAHAEQPDRQAAKH